MNLDSIIAILAIILALGFEVVNGFHDTANAVATAIYTKALKPQVAILMSGILNFAGAIFVGTAVAKVITKIIPQNTISLTIIISVLIGALIWNLLTWWFKLPVSSTHCLVGSLFGAGIAANGISGVSWGELNKVFLALLISPLLGFVGGIFLNQIVLWSSKGKSNILKWMQILSSASVSFSHGGNDGQKTMGIITLILATHFGFSYNHVPFWVIVTCAAAMGLGTVVGGWRVIQTVGTKITKNKIKYGQGFAAEGSTACIILGASILGLPISTTCLLTSSVMGSTLPLYGFKGLNLKTIKLILLAWVLTLPAAALISALVYFLFKVVGILIL